jgi:diguanylate cyclase (GGDEF)-like protein
MHVPLGISGIRNLSRHSVLVKHVVDFVRSTGAWWFVPLSALVMLAGGGVLVLVFLGHASALAVAGMGALVMVGMIVLCSAAVRMILHSEEARHEAELAHQNLQEAMEALPLGLAIYDQQDRLVVLNQEATEIQTYRGGGKLIGQSYETLIRRSLRRGEIPEALGREEEWLQQRMAGRGKLSKPLLRWTADGRWMHFYEIATPSGCLVTMRLDVTELVEKTVALEHSNEQLEHLSTTDALTGLANRRAFDQCLLSEWQRSARSQQPLSLLMIDIDHFKRYNDHYGHLAGDACLRQIAAILFDCAQRSGELVVRYGGEEFALLLPGTDGDAACVVAQRCMDELANAQISHANSPVSPWLTCSVGVATVVASPELVPESLVRCADEALYQVKSAGRASFSVAPCPS